MGAGAVGVRRTQRDPAGLQVGKTVRFTLLLEGGKRAVLVEAGGVGGREVVGGVAGLGQLRHDTDVLRLDGERKRGGGALPQRLCLPGDAHAGTVVGPGTGRAGKMAVRCGVGGGGVGGREVRGGRGGWAEGTLVAPPPHLVDLRGVVGDGLVAGAGGLLGVPATLENPCLCRANGFDGRGSGSVHLVGGPGQVGEGGERD